MSRVLVIEDNPKKFELIQAILEGNEFSFSWVRNARSAYLALEDNSWDIVILDMTFEDSDGIFRQTSKRPLAGMEILGFLEASASRVKAIVVTAHDEFQVKKREDPISFEELGILLESSFPTNYVDIIKAELGKTEWLDMLELYLMEVSK